MNFDIYVLSNKGGRSYMEDTFCLERSFGGNKNWILEEFLTAIAELRRQKLLRRKCRRYFLGV